MTRRRVLWTGVATLGLLMATLVGAGVASGSHATIPNERLGPLHPNQGQTAYYTMCSSDATVRLYWAWGPSVWQSGMNGAVYLQNTPVDCTVYSNVVMQWEGYYFCPSGALACEVPVNYYSHSGHLHVDKATIVWDVAAYNGLTGSRRRMLSAHEFGHVMSLEDHTGNSCGTGTIMGYIDPTPCYESPTTGDIAGARQAYGW